MTSRPLSKEMVLQRALKHLAAGDLSRGALVTKLVRGGAARAEATVVADELIRAGVLSDTRLAAQLADREAARKPIGREQLTAKLVAKGVEAEVAEAAADRALANRDTEADALGMAQRWISMDKSRLDDPAGARRRVGSKLARRGLDAELIERILDRLIPQELPE